MGELRRSGRLVPPALPALAIPTHHDLELATYHRVQGLSMPTAKAFRLARYEAPVSFVDQEVGDDRRARRPQLPARRLIAGLQCPEFFPPFRRGKESLQFLLPLLERFDGGHPHPSGKG